MKQTRTTLKELTAAYRAILRYGMLCNAIALGLIATATPAMAGTITKSDHNGVGGAVTVSDGSNLNYTDVIVFENNKSDDHGAGLYYKNGGAGSSVVFNADVTFDNNEVLSSATSGSGAGMFISGGNVSLLGVNNTFTNNQMNATIASARQYKVGGGAIANQSYAKDFGNDKGTPLDAVMVIGTADSTNKFTGNTSSTNGGAIMNRAVDTDGNATLTINGTTTFENNSAVLNGGAIYNVARDGKTATFNLTNGTYTFTGNTANNGGAIYNEGTMNAGGAFTANTAAKWGGAIYNKGNLTIADNSSFKENKAGSVGGAIANALGTSVLILRKNVSFENNEAAYDGGAIGNYRGATLVDGTTFMGNKAQTGATDVDAIGGGAMSLGAESSTKIANATFTGNTSGFNGGAVGTRNALSADNTGASVDITDSTFTGNKALGTTTSTFKNGTITLTGGNGGALDNHFYKSDAKSDAAYVANSTFKENEAKNGGAIYNNGTADSKGNVASLYLADSNFADNVASDFGGAIYNGGTLALAGTNTFTGNTAGGSANDIYNNGTLNIVSGETTIDGGITGAGALTIANGATLNIGRATISQQTIILEGTLIADVVEGGDYILGATNSFDGNGTLSLAIEKAGTYKLFSDKVFARAQEQITSTVYELDWSTDGGKTVIATTKSADKIASETGIEKESAAVVSNIAQSGSTSDSSSLREMAIKMQQSLAANDTMSVEHAAAALNPEKEVVKQSVTSSVQNTVMNLAATRMIAATMGRNGGDVDLTATGVWAQGLYNKTKMNGHFDGHTLGIAAGVDGTINNDFTVGLGYAFNHSEVSPVSRDIDIDSHTVFVYGQYKPSDWYVNAVLNYTFADYDESGIALGTPVSASYDANAFGGQVVTGYNFAGGITPEFGLRYLHINGSDYTNNIGIKNELKSADYLTAMLGTRYGFNIAVNEDMAFRPELRYAIKYDMISDKSSAVVAMPGIASYTMNGDRLSRVGAELGIGVTMRYQELNVSLNYDIDIREDYTSQTGMLKLRYEF